MGMGGVARINLYLTCVDAPAAKGKTSFWRVARLLAAQRTPPFGLWRACLRTAEPSALKNLHWACGAPAPAPSSKPLPAVPRAWGLRAAQPSGKPLLGARGARCPASDKPLMGVRCARSLLAAQPSGKPSLGVRGARSLRAAQPSNKPLEGVRHACALPSAAVNPPFGVRASLLPARCPAQR